jgi:hypothetical protein
MYQKKKNIKVSILAVLLLILSTSWIFVSLELKRGRLLLITQLGWLQLGAGMTELPSQIGNGTLGAVHTDKGKSTKEIYPEGDCLKRRFGTGGEFPLTALASFPGSGNTWSRHLIEQSTGTPLSLLKCKRRRWEKFGVRINPDAV